MTRYKREFWLDADKDDQLLLLETIDELKRQRRFVSVLRDGIRLIVDLRAGRLDVLFELFPLLVERVQPAKSGKGDPDLERKLDKIMQAIEAQQLPAPPPGYPMMKPVGSPQALTVGKVDLPRFDDDENTVVIKKSTSNDAGQNFLKSAFGLQQ